MLRLFIAIPVPGNIREEIGNLVADLKEVRGLPNDIRFVPEENWHFTLVFLGYQPETAPPLIQSSIKEISHSNILKNIRIGFERLTYGPPGKTPRMIWLTAVSETSRDLGGIKNVLEESLEKNGLRWQKDTRPVGHLTLARFQLKPIKFLPKIEKKMNWGYGAETLDLMRATLLRSEAVYDKIFSVDFPK